MQYHLLGRVETFNYIGRIMLLDNSECKEVSGNLQKAWRKLGRFSRIIILGEEYTWTSWRFYVAVVQSVMMFGSETWVVMTCILRDIGSLHNGATCQISGRMP